MATVSVLVVSPSSDLAPFLSERLMDSRPPASVAHVAPGPGLVDTVRAQAPQVAVVDGIDQRPTAAKLEIALLKDRCPGVRIIAVSGQSSECDAAVVEQSLFYYLAGGNRAQLVRVVEAAVATVPRSRV